MITSTDKTTLVNNHVNYAKTLARVKKQTVKGVSLEELESAAFYGLVHAANTFNPEICPEFKPFAAKRIFGAMSDYLIEISPGTRSKRIKSSQLPDDLQARKERTESTEVFEVVVASLPERTKVILRRAIVQDETLTEISTVVGLHESRISQIIAEARRTLAELWADHKYKLWDSIA